MKRLTRQESQARTRERLLEAAAKAFAKNGFADCSVDSIAEIAGYTKGAFYAHFEAKEDAFLELLRTHKRDEVVALTALFSPKRHVEEILEDVRVALNGAAGETGWGLLSVELQRHAARRPAFAREFRKFEAETDAAYATVIAKGFAHAKRKLPRPAEELAAACGALISGIVLQRAIDLPHREQLLPGDMVVLFIRSLIETAPKQ